jgi:hypothetical protein
MINKFYKLVSTRNKTIVFYLLSSFTCNSYGASPPKNRLTEINSGAGQNKSTEEREARFTFRFEENLDELKKLVSKGNFQDLDRKLVYLDNAPSIDEAKLYSYNIETKETKEILDFKIKKRGFSIREFLFSPDKHFLAISGNFGGCADEITRCGLTVIDTKKNKVLYADRPYGFASNCRDLSWSGSTISVVCGTGEFDTENTEDFIYSLGPPFKDLKKKSYKDPIIYAMSPTPGKTSEYLLRDWKSGKQIKSFFLPEVHSFYKQDVDIPYLYVTPSPSLQKIAFIIEKKRGGALSSDLWIAALNEKSRYVTKIQLDQSTQNSQLTLVYWSPDESHLAYTVIQNDIHKFQLFHVNGIDSKVIYEEHHAGIYCNPWLSGELLYFTVYGGAKDDIKKTEDVFYSVKEKKEIARIKIRPSDCGQIHLL